MSESATPGRAIVWGPQMQDLLEMVEAKIAQGEPSNLHLALRRFLEILRDRRGMPTPSEVAEAVYLKDKPGAGWLGWEDDEWREYTPQIVEALRTSNPAQALQL